MTEDETSDGGSDVATARRALVPFDLAFTSSSMTERNAPFPRHRRVKDMQHKSIRRCLRVGVSLPPHLRETVHDADATRKFWRKDAVQGRQHGRKTKQNQVLHVKELNEGQGESA